MSRFSHPFGGTNGQAEGCKADEAEGNIDQIEHRLSPHGERGKLGATMHKAAIRKSPRSRKGGVNGSDPPTDPRPAMATGRPPLMAGTYFIFQANQRARGRGLPCFVDLLLTCRGENKSRAVGRLLIADSD